MTCFAYSPPPPFPGISPAFPASKNTSHPTAASGRKVWSVSYGFPELWQCSVAEGGCEESVHGYDPTLYLNRTNVELAKLAAMGVRDESRRKRFLLFFGSSSPQQTVPFVWCSCLCTFVFSFFLCSPRLVRANCTTCPSHVCCFPASKR